MDVLRRYRAEARFDSGTVVVKDDTLGRVIARCDTADDASKITAALNDDEGAVEEREALREFVRDFAALGTIDGLIRLTERAQGLLGGK